MSLADILSLDGMLSTMIQNRILMLRPVSRNIMMALESNICLQVKLRIIYSGVTCLTDFLKRWHGSVLLHCSWFWNPDDRWFKEVRDALLLGQLRPLKLLNLSVEGCHLIPLTENLSKIGPAIRQLELTCIGNGAQFLAAAAALASLGNTSTIKLTVLGDDHAGRMLSLWLQRLLASNIIIDSISFRLSPLILQLFGGD
jgi:hypothetical protein